MSDMLQKICAMTRAETERRKTIVPFGVLDRQARRCPPPRGFTAALQARRQAHGIALITEIKQASPSAGVIRRDFNPVTLARDYEQAGAACLSVLTDGPFFQGRIKDLTDARAATSLPVLRKDFMLDVWQVAEARTIAADCILLIMAALADVQALELHAAAVSYGMDVLIEVHDREELDRALKLPSGMIGINNRNLKTLKTDLGTTETLSAHVPKDHLLISESGIATAADIKRLRQCGADCFLIGESLLKQGDVVEAIARLQPH